MKISTVIFCTLMLLASCKTQNVFVKATVPAQRQVTDADSAFQKEENYEYHLRKDDKVNISVWNNDDVSVGSVYGIYNSAEGYGKWLMIDKKGEISIPAVGSIKVDGLTLVELKNVLQKELSKTILNPVIDVKVLNKEVTVLGEVKKPGKHLMEKEDYDLLDVIGMAGDFDTYADKRRVQIIRKNKGIVNTIVLDITSMKNYVTGNIMIHPGDVVLVHSKKGKDWDKRAGASIIPTGSAITALILIFKLFM